MQFSLLHRCTKVVMLKKQMRRKGRHLRSYRHLAYRRLRLMRQIREELIQKVRKAIGARQRDMEQVQRDQARHEVARMVATYKKWLHNWSRSLLSQRRLIVQQEMEERHLDRRLRLLRKQLGRHRRPQRLLGSCLRRLRNALARAPILHATVEGQAEQETEEVRRYLSPPYDTQKKSRKSIHSILSGFSQFWDVEVRRKKPARMDTRKTVSQNPSGQLYVVPAMPAQLSMPRKRKKNPVPDYVNLIELPSGFKRRRLRKKRKRLEPRAGDTSVPSPTIDELWQMYADLVAVEAPPQSKPKKTQRKRRRKRSRSHRHMDLKELLDLDMPSDVNVLLKSKVVRKKSPSGKSKSSLTSKVKRTAKQALTKRKSKKEKYDMKPIRDGEDATPISPIRPFKRRKKRDGKEAIPVDTTQISNFETESVSDETETGSNDQPRMDRQTDRQVPKRKKVHLKLSKEQREFRKNRKTGNRITDSTARKETKGEWLIQERRPAEPDPEHDQKIFDPYHSSEGQDVTTSQGQGFRLADLVSDRKYSTLQRLLRSVIENNSVLDGATDVQALMAIVGKHNMWNNLAGLYTELLTTGMNKSDIVPLLSKKYLDYIRAIEKRNFNNLKTKRRSLSDAKYKKIENINVHSEMMENIGWLNENMRAEYEPAPAVIFHDVSKDGLISMYNSSERMDSDQIKKLIDQEKEMERNLRSARRRKLASGTFSRLSSSSMSGIWELDPNEEKDLLNFELRYSVKSIRNMLEKYTQHFQSLPKSQIIQALEKERSLAAGKQEAMGVQSLATPTKTSASARKRRPYIPKKKKLRPAQKLFYSPRQTCRVRSISDELDDCECCSVSSDESWVDVYGRHRVYEKCPQCGVKVELPAPTPTSEESLRSLSQGSIEACAKNELMRSTVADICTHCGYIHDKCQSCPQLPICPVPLHHLRLVEEAVRAQIHTIPREPPEKKPEVPLCCSPCGKLR